MSRADLVRGWRPVVLLIVLLGGLVSPGCDSARGPAVGDRAPGLSAPAESQMNTPGRPVDKVPMRTVQWSNSQWAPRARTRDWKYIVLHHTASEAGSVETIHRSHLERRDAAGNLWKGIGYHFVIGNGRGMEDGEVEATFRWREQIQGAHAGVQEYNEQGIGICLVGNFERGPPTPAQQAAVTALIQELAETCKIAHDQVHLHSDLKSTECPGKFFPVNEILKICFSATQTDRHK